MKKKLILYDSYFGNTEQIARAIAAGIGEAEALKVDAINPAQLNGLDLLVVGSPTRGFHATPAISKLLKNLPPNGLTGVQVAAFDTRMTEKEIEASVFFLKYLVKIFGYAAEPLAAWLIKKGGTPVLPPEGFFVEATEGPLLGGELERATAWGQKMAARDD